MSVHPNPWGREYSDEEWRAASFLYNQYTFQKDRTGGPLIYKSGEYLVAEVQGALIAAKMQVEKMELLLSAVQRETLKTEFVDE